MYECELCILLFFHYIQWWECMYSRNFTHLYRNMYTILNYNYNLSVLPKTGGEPPYTNAFDIEHVTWSCVRSHTHAHVCLCTWPPHTSDEMNDGVLLVFLAYYDDRKIACRHFHTQCVTIWQQPITSNQRSTLLKRRSTRACCVYIYAHMLHDSIQTKYVVTR